MHRERLSIVSFLTIMVLFTLIVPVFASNNSGDSSEKLPDCRKNLVLVFRFVNQDYVCTSVDTAKRWITLGMAKFTKDEMVEKTDVLQLPQQKSEFPSNSSSKKIIQLENKDVKCRDGYALVFRFMHKDSFCTSQSTAVNWVQLGLAEIIQNSTSKEQVIENKTDGKTIKDTNESIDVSNKTNILPPTYTEQLSINQKPIVENVYSVHPAVYQVNKRIWVASGYDSVNTIMIEGEKEIIIIDTLSTYESAKNAMKEFRKITDKPVKTIIYTHGDSDHVQGTRAFLDDEDKDVKIIAQQNNSDFYINKNGLLGQITLLRNAYASGFFLPDDGPDKNNLNVFGNVTSRTNAYLPPTDTFSDELDLDISGVKMNLIHVADESSDQIYVWLPEDKSLLVGDTTYGIFPNIDSLGGTIYHNPMKDTIALDKAIQLEPEFLITSHIKPVIGKENVRDVLVSTRDATQYIYDQTIRGMNKGYTSEELSQTIKLPKELEDYPWLSKIREQIPWYVKQIYYGNLGGFNGDPTFLQPVSIDEKSKKIVAGFRGIDNTILNIQNSISRGEYDWAAELATYALHVEPENQEVKTLKAHSLRELGQRTLSEDARNWYLTSALELEGKIPINSETFSKTNAEQIIKLPAEELLKILPVKLNPNKVKGIDQILNIYYPDIDKAFTLHFRNSIVIVSDGIEDQSNNTVILDFDTHKLILNGKITLADGINSEKIEIDGDVDKVIELMNLFEPLTSN